MASPIVQLLFGISTPGNIGNLVLDTTISDDHQYENEITDFPVESGANIADHVIQKPEQVTIEGFVTNTPVQFLSAFREGGVLRNTFNLLTGEEVVDKVQDALEKLLSIAGYSYPTQPDENEKEVKAKNPPQLVNIITGLRSYSNMAIKSLSIRRDKDTGQTLRFRGVFKKVVLTEIEFEAGLVDSKLDSKEGAGDTKKKGPPVKKKGDQKPKAAPPTSALFKGGETFGVVPAGVRK